MPLSPDPSRAGTPDVLAELAEIVRLVMARPVEDVQEDCAFVDGLRIDSLSMVEILEGAAQHFGVRIEDEAAKDFVLVGDLVDHISTRLV